MNRTVNVAVLTCTWDRLDYTRHCFARLRDLAGCEFDHYILDQGSNDGTAGWLQSEYPAAGVWLSDVNVGIWAGFNRLAGLAGGGYDVYVTFDNDCELATAGALRGVCEAALDHDMALSPRILGLRNPPPPVRVFDGIEETAAIGNIFMALPAWAVAERRFPDGTGPFDESKPPWGGDEGPLAAWMRGRGSGVGYVTGYEAWHYRTTDGQHVDHPGYFARKRGDGCPC